MPITAFYAALLAMLFLFLSFRTIEQRRGTVWGLRTRDRVLSVQEP